VQITELDIEIRDYDDPKEFKKRQAEMYATVLTDLVKIKRNGGKITCITLWGTSDLYGSSKSLEGTLFARPDKPKDVYYAVLQAYLDAGFKVR